MTIPEVRYKSILDIEKQVELLEKLNYFHFADLSC